LFGAANVQFDPLKFNWLGNATRDVQLGVSWKTSPVKTFQDAVKTELIVGATALDGETAQVPLILNATTGTKFKIVTGYRGGNEILLAMERGEIDARISWTYESLAATKLDWLTNGNINVLFQSGTSPSPHLPNVPLALDFAKGPTERRILELLFTKLDLARPYTLPPGVPEERVAAMEKAFMSTMLDPEFVADAAKLQIEISAVDGDQTRAIVERAVSSPPEVITRIREILGGGG
jgi:tripartite-type tricarboxylate transporter receptor subunit TctC